MEYENYVEAPIFHSIICKCGKKLLGAFKQDDGTFLCATCVINKVEREGMLNGVEEALDLVMKELLPKERPTKKRLRKVESILKAILSVYKKETK